MTMPQASLHHHSGKGKGNPTMCGFGLHASDDATETTIVAFSTRCSLLCRRPRTWTSALPGDQGTQLPGHDGAVVGDPLLVELRRAGERQVRAVLEGDLLEELVVEGIV